MIYVGDSVILENMEAINKLYCLNLQDGLTWKLDTIIASSNGWGGDLKRQKTFLFMFHHPCLSSMLPLSIDEFESCAKQIIPIKRSSKVKLCSQSI